MPAEKTARFHHYVPKFIIKNFAKKRKKQFYVNVFDKHSGKTFVANILEVFGENDFNKIVVDGYEFNTEEVTADFDNVAAPIIRKIVDTESVSGLEPSEIEGLMMFLALQLNRSASSRAMYADIIAQHRTRLVADAGEENLPVEISQFDASEKLKLFTMIFSIDVAKDFASVLQSKTLLLMKSQNNGLLLGDSPVSVWNSRLNAEAMIDLGLAAEGIEIYMPISPSLVLALWCPDIANQYQAALETAKRREASLSARRSLSQPEHIPKIEESLVAVKDDIIELESVIASLRQRLPVSLSPDNVTHQNSLQIKHAERYVVSPDGNFYQTQAMLESNASFLRGRRITVT